MSLPIRRFRHLKRARQFAGQTAIDGETIIRSKVWPTDHDAFGHMTNTRYVAFADIARADWMVRTGFDHVLSEKGLRPYCDEETALFFKALRFPTRFKVITRLADSSESALIFESRFMRGETLGAQFTSRIELRDRADDPQPVDNVLKSLKTLVEQA